MENFDISKNRLGTTGINPCVGFIAFLNDGEYIFIEHLSDISLPTAINLDNVRECFEDTSEHIDDALRYGNITYVHSIRRYKTYLLSD
jgi:hypothetical protein